MVVAGDPSSSPVPGGAPITEEEALDRLRQTDDQSLQYYAAWWLGKMRSRHPDTLPLLCRALGQRLPRREAAGVEHNAVARNAARALGKLGQAEAVPALLESLEDDDDGLREAAARALGDLGAASAIAPLCRRLASGLAGAGAVRTDSSRLIEPCEAFLEALGEIGQAHPDVVAVIRPFIGHERPLIRSAACRALLQLTSDPRWGEQLVQLLEHPQLQVRRAALMDLGASGWRPALEPIRRTLAENSLKLIALRGLAEQLEPPSVPGAVDVAARAADSPHPDPATTAVLAVMDDLL